MGSEEIIPVVLMILRYIPHSQQFTYIPPVSGNESNDFIDQSKFM